MAVAFSAILTGGKLLIASRHPSFMDVVVNLLGAAVGLYMHQRFARRQ